MASGTVKVYIVSVFDEGQERKVKCSSLMFTPDGLFIVADNQNYNFPSSALLSVASVIEHEDDAAEDPRKPWLHLKSASEDDE
jgi:hypothetical protein